MKVLLQRVRHARVEVDSRVVGEIGVGLLVFMGLEKTDDTARVEQLLKRLLAYRIFADDTGRMNRSVQDVGGAVLLVSQFTLAAETGKGLRPGFSLAADPEQARLLYQHGLDYLMTLHAPVASGEFGADMQISLCNDGPVTFLLEN